MKIKPTALLFLLNLTFAQPHLYAQNYQEERILGLWRADVKMGEDYLRLVFDIRTDTDKTTIAGTVSSPDKGIEGIPISDISLVGDSIRFDIAAAMASFTGAISSDKLTIPGIWKEGEAKQHVVLKIATVDEVAAKPKRSTIYPMQFSNENFNFYLEDQDLVVLEDLVHNLNKSYLELTALMKTNFSTKIDVLIYPNISAFHKAIYLENAPEWIVGAAGKNELKLVSPRNPGNVHNYESLLASIVQELCHTVVINMTKHGRVGLPKWLDEGLAFYYANQLTEEAKIANLSGLAASEIPTWSNLANANTYEFAEMNGYIFSASIVEYLIDKYGYESVRMLILNPNYFEKIIGKTEVVAEKDWKKYVLKMKQKTN